MQLTGEKVSGKNILGIRETNRPKRTVKSDKKHIGILCKVLKM